MHRYSFISFGFVLHFHLRSSLTVICFLHLLLFLLAVRRVRESKFDHPHRTSAYILLDFRTSSFNRPPFRALSKFVLMHILVKKLAGFFTHLFIFSHVLVFSSFNSIKFEFPTLCILFQHISSALQAILNSY